jgi:hypothetical protein
MRAAPDPRDNHALELARVLADGTGLGPRARLPATVAELTRVRLAGLHLHVREVSLAASALAAPTVELLIRALNDARGMLSRDSAREVHLRQWPATSVGGKSRADWRGISR